MRGGFAFWDEQLDDCWKFLTVELMPCCLPIEFGKCMFVKKSTGVTLYREALKSLYMISFVTHIIG